jgi:hypothetical protein
MICDSWSRSFRLRTRMKLMYPIKRFAWFWEGEGTESESKVINQIQFTKTRHDRTNCNKFQSPSPFEKRRGLMYDIISRVIIWFRYSRSLPPSPPHAYSCWGCGGRTDIMTTLAPAIAQAGLGRGFPHQPDKLLTIIGWVIRTLMTPSKTIELSFIWLNVKACGGLPFASPLSLALNNACVWSRTRADLRSIISSNFIQPRPC